jgi:predicted transcriptional regulator
MVKVNADEWLARHSGGLAAAGTKIREGVEKVTVSPGVKAAENIVKMRTNLIAAFDDGRVERGLKNVDLDYWKRTMLDKGIPAISAGAEAAKEKNRPVIEKLLAFETGLQTKVNAMKVITIDDSIAKAGAWMRGMHEFKK